MREVKGAERGRVCYNPRRCTAGYARVAKLRAVIFDLNGTLLDDIELNIKTVRVIFNFFDIPPPDVPTWRRGLAGGVKEFYERYGIPTNDEAWSLMNCIRERILEESWREATLRPDARAFIHFCVRKNLFRGIVSSETPHLLFRWLHEFDIAKYFNFIRTGEWNKEQALRETVSLFGCAPEEACYLDDTPFGIAAAKRAGLVTFGFLSGHAAPELIRAAKPTHAVSSFSETLALMEDMP